MQPIKPAHIIEGVIPCAVPPWAAAQKEFFSKGGRYSEKLGYHVLETDYLPDVDEWLPMKWAYRGSPPHPVILPDMLPTSAWQDNLRTRLTQEEWGRLRKFCYAASGFTCQACGSRGEPHVEAHEAWRFDERTGVQHLKGIVCLCPTCHKIKHLGYARRLGIEADVYGRLLWLNDWDLPALKKALAQITQQQEKLSQRTWKLDLSFLQSYGVR